MDDINNMDDIDKSNQKPVLNDDDDNHNHNGDGSIVVDSVINIQKRKASDNIDDVNDNDNNDHDDHDDGSKSNDNDDNGVSSVMNVPPKKRQVFMKMKDKKYLQSVEKRAPRIGSDYQAQL